MSNICNTCTEPHNPLIVPCKSTYGHFEEMRNKKLVRNLL